MRKTKDSYHHGDLRAALLAAGEAVLAETGVEGFSLRLVAKRVGVSHSAPAHHFGDAQGLLTALAAEGFRRFLLAMQARQQGIGDDPRARLLASGHGYIDFAESAPALFRLMFASDRINREAPDFVATSEAAFRHLVDDVARLRGVSPFDDAAGMADVMASWSIVHGFAELLISGRMKTVERLTRPEREAFFETVFRRTVATVTKKQRETVTLSRREHENLIRRAEDGEDRATIAAHEARELALGKEVARADNLPMELVRRMLEGESPVRIWREHRGMKARELATVADVAPGYLSEIERGKKPGSFDAMARIAKALNVRMEDLA